MYFSIEFSEEKNLLLKATRGINFNDIFEAIEKGELLDDLESKNKSKYPNQKILVVKIENYVYAVPYVLDPKRKIIFLKTVYPSRLLTRRYLKKAKK
ncbi:hypothetical protein A2W14_02535 [Candidatus Gottesmanbacteria bacterium RBG_16_37_8]|uniref:Toxin n=1 Tax=Candidatus Gottesmanbacteria bacterium RBG_16_37_8 TaxID=1798371 RepID=A0A1F5YQ23_9BACT|nr:MAG: hypothetical protein A2W14_02535 [Candidatus Gottesmanbacteria bacterium RBG_16_37_8]